MNFFRLLLILLLFAGCTRENPDRALMVSTADGANVYCTRHLFESIHGESVEMMIDSDGGMGIGTTNGFYNVRSNICYVVCADPSHPTEREQHLMLHEIGHRLMEKYGWDAARPIWIWLAWNEPSLMTHKYINDRIRAEGQWPSTWPLTLFK